MPWHVIFTEDGLAEWIGVEPREGSEEIGDKLLIGEEEVRVDVLFLAGNRRTADGTWIPRPPRVPTEEELAEAARVLAEGHAQSEAARLRSIDEEVARRAQPDALLRAMGKITIAELSARVAAIRLEVEAGN